VLDHVITVRDLVHVGAAGLLVAAVIVFVLLAIEARGDADGG
jgi:hypothetical protein